MVDIGDHVKEGELIAEIDTPTVDEELAQAFADLAQAKAQLIGSKAALEEAKARDKVAIAQVQKAKADQLYASVTADRWQNMATRGAVSLQSRDEKVRSLSVQNASVDASTAQEIAALDSVSAASAQVKVAKALVVAKDATVAKYKAQQDFKFVRAPFDGVITARKVDPGQLITAGSQSQNLELFQIAKLDVLRIYVNVPQTISRYLEPGLIAELAVSTYPERTFKGLVTNVAGALDPKTRTRQTEIKIDNKNKALLPGMYSQVKLTVKRPETWVRVPSNTVIPRSDSMEVVVVEDGRAHYRKVVIGRDFGDELEIKAGLKGSETVIVSPQDDIREGDQVKPIDIASNNVGAK